MDINNKKTNTNQIFGSPNISRILTLSTKHIRKKTAISLSQMDPGTYGIPIYQMKGCGWLVHIPDNWQGISNHIHQDLRECIDLASKNGCEWLCLDHKGKEVALPVYDWENEADRHKFNVTDILASREAGMLDRVFPSGTNIPFTFKNGEKNSLDVGRDKEHAYLILHNCMSEKHAMNITWTNKGGWPACIMREYIQHIYYWLIN